MVASTDSPPPPPPPFSNPPHSPPHGSNNPSPPDFSAGSRPHQQRGGVRRLLASGIRIADLQYRIWLTQAKMTVKKLALFAGLFAGAAVLGLLSIIFLFIGLFRILTDVLHIPAVWSYLIFGAVMLALAGTLIFMGMSALNKKDDDDEPKKGAKQ